MVLVRVPLALILRLTCCSEGQKTLLIDIDNQGDSSRFLDNVDEDKNLYNLTQYDRGILKNKFMSGGGGCFK